MLPGPTSRAAALGAFTLLATALAAPAAATPRVAAFGALGAASSGPYSAFSTGDVLFANAASLPLAAVARASTGQTAAGVAVGGGPLTTTDQLGQPLLVAAKTGKTAYGHSAGVNVALLGGETDPPQIAETLVEATSPAPNASAGSAGSVPAAPLLAADVLPGRAVANTAANGSCVTEKDISSGSAHVANADVANVGDVTVASLGATSEATSSTRLIQPTKADGTVVNTGKSGLLGQTTLNLAPLTVLAGTPGAITIKVLAPIQLAAAAGGVAGTSVVSYGAVGRSGSQPVVEITGGGQSQTLTADQVFGGNGIVLPLGVADVTIGSPAHSLTGLEGSTVTEAANGTQAAAAADFLRVSVPGKLSTPGQDPIDGPLAALNQVLNPVLSGLDPVLSDIQDALAGARLNVADIRLGHLEAVSTVPAGGIDCGSVDNPLDESMKDVSALHVARGAAFDYDIRIPNRGTSPVTGVKVVDTYTAGLEFVKAVPAPASRSGNTVTFDLGTVQPNEFETIVLTFRVPADAVTGTKYHNEALITGTYNGDAIEKTVEVDGPTVGPDRIGDCDLSGSTKFASNTQVTAGESFGYFVDILNSGGQPCLDVTVSDALVDGVGFVSCTAGCTHSGQVVTWKLGTFAPGESRVVGVVVKVTATSGRLPNTAVITTPSGTGGQPSTPGPVVTNVSVPSPGHPADGPNGSLPRTDADGMLPRTGLPAAPAAVAVAMMIGAAVLLRRRVTS